MDAISISVTLVVVVVVVVVIVVVVEHQKIHDSCNIKATNQEAIYFPAIPRPVFVSD